MATKIRSDGQWISLENTGGVTIPTGFDGSWTHTVTKQEGQFYTNTTGNLIYVSATFGVRTSGPGLVTQNTEFTAGTSLWAYVSPPGSTSTNLADYFEVGRVRDNGTNQAENVVLNARFFVPHNCKYIVKFYDNDLNEWSEPSYKVLYQWSEFELNLTTPANTFNSTGPNSNNFNRALKAPSSGADGVWSQFMKDNAVWHEPGNALVLNQTYSTTYTIDITDAGDYTLEYAADNVGNISFDGTNVASNFGGLAKNPPNSTTLSSVTAGTHTIVATISNSGTNTNWNDNPAGIAWKIKPVGT
jgi:hypothetical protein|tara:strand:- start:980 stop:1882 length:903 start_codon:yes stop_codon:yes gene_type:complete